MLVSLKEKRAAAQEKRALCGPPILGADLVRKYKSTTHTAGKRTPAEPAEVTEAGSNLSRQREVQRS